MTLNDLGITLSNLYNNVPKGEAVAMIHVFGVKYAKALQENKFKKKKIVKAANIPESYGTEISKGIKLAKYVNVKDTI